MEDVSRRAALMGLATASVPVADGRKTVRDLGALGNDTANDASAFSGAAPGSYLLVPPGIYRIRNNIRIAANLIVMPGALIKPAASVTVTFGARVHIEAGSYRIFDNSLGGAFAQGGRTLGPANAEWFPGTTDNVTDLGKQINNAFDWGFLHITVPSSDQHEIRTTVRIRQGSRIDFGAYYPQNIICRTSNKPVFEAIGHPVRDFRVTGGAFYGWETLTPSCFFLIGADLNGSQVGNGTPLDHVMVTGHFGQGILVHIAAEVTTYSECLFNFEGVGDSPYTGPRATVIIGNADYWSTPYSFQQPRPTARSTSAIIFDNCTILEGLQGRMASAMLLKGRVDDLKIGVTYLNATSRCGILCENGGGSGPIRVHLTGGRYEMNRGVEWPGCPLVIASNCTVTNLTVDNFGIFPGDLANSTPFFKSEGAGSFFALTIRSCNVEWSSGVLLSHTTADLEWADIQVWRNFTIDCSGRSLIHCDIKSAGQVFGKIGPTNKIRASNVTQW